MELKDTKHPIWGKRLVSTFELKSDGWYYSSDGYRFHAISEKGKFTEVWDLEVLNGKSEK